ncbi:M3 family metallopeptidase [Candidatus Mycoplasma haematominutum]|nr:M3 family metallopeptidase [Candidatus Mycoplasma haematominutum]
MLLEGKSLDSWIEKIFKYQQEILEKYKGNPFSSMEKLMEFHHLKREFRILSSRVKSYISNKQNVEQFEHKWLLLEQELIQKSIPFAQQLANFSDQAIKNRKLIEKYLEHPDFSHFKRYYEVLFRYKRHKLSPTLAKFELTFAPLSSSYYEIFNTISEKEFKLTGVINSSGEELTICTYPEYLKNMKSEDGILRKNLYLKYVDFVNSKKESLYRVLFYHFLSLNIESKNIAFKGGYFEAALYGDEVNQKFIFDLYKNMKSLKDLIKQFREFRKKLIAKLYNLEQFHDWDGYLELKIGEKMKTYSIEEAKEIILGALSVLGDKYISEVKTIFNNPWIDWLPRKGKMSGAYYSGGAYKLPGKYILLNYNSYFDDVLTIAHELGHAVHELKIDGIDTYYSSPTIFTTEIPSIFNEILLNYYFLKKFRNKDNKLQQLYIYDHLLTTFVNTATVQLIYSEWEYIFSNKILNTSALNPDIAAEDYANLLSDYLGKEVKKNRQDYTWHSLYKILTIPHFYSGEFYLYKYAVGLITSLLLAERILNLEDKNSQIEAFNKFLQSGSSHSNLDTLEMLSISLKEKSNWKKIKGIFQSWLSEYIKIAEEIYCISKN